ncbi:MAG: type II toxin-antitoxin system Phd/YefM family antitoxin [Fimbriimonas sp.]
MMINIAEAKAKLSSLVKEAASGQDVILCDRNRPVARLVAIGAPGQVRESRVPYEAGTGLRRLGLMPMALPESILTPFSEAELDEMLGEVS